MLLLLMAINWSSKQTCRQDFSKGGLTDLWS